MIDPRDILFLSCIRKYGTLSRRIAPISRGGEDIQETFTRAAPNAYYTDGGGVLRQATTNVPRVTYLDPLTSGTRDPYWLLEDTRTNVVLMSQGFNGSLTVAVSGGSGIFIDGENVSAGGGGTGVYIAGLSSAAIFCIQGAAGTFTGTLTGATSLATRTCGTLTTAWKQSRASISPNADAAPDGTTTADRLVEDGTVTSTHETYAPFTLTANAICTVSIYAKAGTRSWILVSFQQTAVGGNYARCYFNLGTGVKGTQAAAGTGAITLATIDPMGNGYYRCIVVGSVGGGVTSGTLRISMATGDNGENYSGNGSGYVTLWGAQAENAVSSPSSYIPTVAASVARATEVPSFPFYAAPQAMTLYARFVELGSRYDTAIVRRLLNIGTSYTGAAPDSLIALNVPGGNGFYNLLHAEAATQVNSVMAASPTYGQLVELRGVVSSTGTVQLNQSINLGAESSAAASGALALPSSWSTPQITPSGDPGSTFRGWAAFDTIAVIRGTPSLTELRALRA